ncbi:MAG: SMP-30/gluconolactonase/LRE family protein [Pseudomonadales bacterium]|nr:SMP-30/gluconolactonase/LRE family protein [Pseudomonadales bacterium]MCP5185707.1 SMP-30/gluconolactonase/LRE family protein [Pseudomonadales bacterium]
MTLELTGRIFAEGLCFPEGPRWHDGALWLSDMHADTVLRFAADGTAYPVVTVAGQPSGLGWLPNGELLIVSMQDRKVLRFDGHALHLHADLMDLASWHCNDMVVDGAGRAYVGNFGFDLHAGAEQRPAELILVQPDGGARVVARDLLFPNGTVITPDGRTLIVGESFGGRLTAFDIAPNGDLSNRRVWAQLPTGEVPDGICLDADGAIWVASPTTGLCLRVREGGQVTHTVSTGQGAFACMLGGTNLYVLAANGSDPDKCREERSGRVLVAAAPAAGAGWP